MTDKCSVKKCPNLYTLVYLGKPICEEHWDKLADNKIKLRKALGLKPEKSQDE